MVLKILYKGKNFFKSVIKERLCLKNLGFYNFSIIYDPHYILRFTGGNINNCIFLIYKIHCIKYFIQCMYLLYLYKISN